MLAKKLRKALSLFLATVMTLSSVGMVTAFASGNNSEVQIETQKVEGKDLPSYYAYDESAQAWTVTPGTEAALSLEEGKVLVNKTITGTSVENEFQINLEVTTMENVQELSVSPDAATVLLLDMSNSMEPSSVNNNGNSANEDRVTMAHTAAKDFLDTYADVSGDAQRLISIVQFGSNAATVYGWNSVLGDGKLLAAKTAVDSTAVNYTVTCPAAGTHSTTKDYGQYGPFGRYWGCNFKEANGRTCDSEKSGHTHTVYCGGGEVLVTDSGATNIHGALRLADNLLGQLSTDNQYAGIKNLNVILLTDGQPTQHSKVDDSSTTLVKSDGGGGGQATSEDYNNSVSAAAALRAKSTLHTVFLSNSSSTTLNKSGNYSLGLTGGNTVQNYLKQKIASSNSSYVSGNITGLKEAFKKINSSITMLSQAWILTEPMARVFAFGDFVDAGTRVTDGILSVKDGVASWNIRGDKPSSIKKEGENTTWYTYTMAYTVRLNNLDSGVAPGNFYKVNAVAPELSYILSDKDGKVDPDALKTVKLATPAVKSLFGDFAFTKVAYGKALAGATFLLTHDANCTCGAPERSMMSTNSTTAEMKNVSFANAPSGHRYTVTETAAPEDYTASTEKYPIGVVFGFAGNNTPTGRACGPDGLFTVENFLKETYTTVPVTKTWVDGGQQSRPDIEITLTQYKNGNATDKSWTKTLTNNNVARGNNNQWNWTFTGLPALDTKDGVAYTYKAAETMVPDGYTSTANTDGTSLINVSTGTTSVIGTKTWIDDGSTRHAVDIELLANGKSLVPAKTVTLQPGETKYEFLDLPKFDTAGVIEYSVRENTKLTNYTVEQGEGKYDLINRVNQQINDTLTVNVQWLDDSNKYTTRPDSVAVDVSNGTDSVASIDLSTANATVSEDKNTWSYTFNGKFPVYEVDDQGKVTGKRINYTMTQSEAKDAHGVDTYVTTVNGLTASNLLTGTTSVSGTKEWVDEPVNFSGQRPDVTIKLVETGETTELVNDAFKFENLAKYTASGVKIPYTAVEIMYGDNSHHFVAGVKNNQDGTFTATNTYTALFTVSGEKKWVDNNNAQGTRPSSIQVQLLDVTDANAPINVGSPVTVTPNESGEWLYKFENLAQYKTITTTVPGAPAIDDTTGGTTGDANTGDANTGDSNTGDANTGDATTGDTTTGGTLEAISVQNNQGGETVTTTEEVEIVYAVQEVGTVSGTLSGGISYHYKVTGGTKDDSYNLTNTLAGNVNITGTKTWNDNGNKWETRPAAALLEILANGVKATTPLPMEDGTYSIDMPAFDATGALITYSVKEQPIHGYTSVLAANGRDLTNNLTQQYTKVDVVKTWIDGGRTEHPTITVNLLQNGVEIAEATLESGVTQHTFLGTTGQETEASLPLYQMDEAGNITGKYSYTVTEDAVEGYKTETDGYNITNTLADIKQTFNFRFTKQWIAPAGYDLPLTEAKFTITGGAEDLTVTGAQMTWNEEKSLYEYTSEALPLYSPDGNTTYNYTVEETTVPEGFTSSRTKGTNDFLNTIKPGEVTLTGTKTWNVADGDARTDFGIEVNVFRDGNPLFTQTVNSSEKEFSFEINRDANDNQPLPMYDTLSGKKYVYTMTETPVEGFTATSEVNSDGAYLFTNSFKSYTYQVNAHYTATVDGVEKVKEILPVIADTTINYVDGVNLTVPLDTEAYKVLASAPEYAFGYTGGTVTLGKDNTTLAGNTLTLSNDVDTYVIDLYYAYTFNSPIKYTVSVNYLDYATRNNPTPTAISAGNTTEGEISSMYNVSGWDRLPISGYTYVTTTGDAVTGSLDGNKTINVWYSLNAVDPGPGPGPGPGPDPGPGPIDPGPGPETDITDPDVPLGELPEVEIPETDVPLAEEPEMEIPDEEVPLGDVPQTGDNSRAMLFGALALTSAAGMAYLTLSSRKKEEEAK